MHPVVRGYAYDRLGDRQVVHIRLIGYFTAIPMLDQDNVQSLDDLAPSIELYHHMIRAKRYEQATELFRGRLVNTLYYRLGAYQTCIELLLTLFPEGEERPPQLEDEREQAWALNMLGVFYGRSGQLRRAVQLLEASNVIDQTSGYELGIAVSLGNLANRYTELGELAAAERNLRHGIELCREIENEFQEAIGHQELGLLLGYQGMFEEATQETSLSIAYCKKEKHQQGYCQNMITLALRSLLMRESSSAYESAFKARELADERSYERDIIRAEWLIGAVLVMQTVSNNHNRFLTEAESHLTEALTRCRRINMIDHEPDILLAWAKWHQLQGNAAQARADADEALAIADRCEYRLKQADIHNFLARLTLDAGDRAAARREAEIARERAWCDGPPHCYKPALDEAERLLAEIG
jgi:tetratricopeptide (TPR) repeat protein